MARYDRIARLDPPAREHAFDGWLTLRDLQGREREPELGRRALTRFLALRPVRRLLADGLDGPTDGSWALQLDAVRDHLEDLPRNHRDREPILRYLEEIGGRAPLGLVRATIDVAASAEAAGHLYSAEEFYRTGLELSAAHGLTVERMRVLRMLARVQREREEWPEARASLEESLRLADAEGAGPEWARSLEALAVVELRQGRVEDARAILDRIRQSNYAAEPMVRAIADAGACALELVVGSPEDAVQAGWDAVQTLEPGDARLRNRVLLDMAAGFRRLGMSTAAASCYEIVIRWARWPEHRIEARLEYALTAAEAGERTDFLDRRGSVLDTISAADRPLEAMIHLGLGRGALLVAEPELAQEHLRETVSIAGDLKLEELLEQAESLLRQADDRIAPGPPARTEAPDAGARTIAERIHALASEAL